MDATRSEQSSKGKLAVDGIVKSLFDQHRRLVELKEQYLRNFCQGHENDIPELRAALNNLTHVLAAPISLLELTAREESILSATRNIANALSKDGVHRCGEMVSADDLQQIGEGKTIESAAEFDFARSDIPIEMRDTISQMVLTTIGLLDMLPNSDAKAEIGKKLDRIKTRFDVLSSPSTIIDEGDVSERLENNSVIALA